MRKFVERLDGPLGIALSLIVGSWAVLAASLRPEVGRAGSLVAVAAILVSGAVAVAIFRGRSSGPWSTRGTIALSLVGLVCGGAAALVPAVLAPRGLDPRSADPWVVLALFTLGAVGVARSRLLWWAACGVGLGLAAVIAVQALPAWPGLAGYEEPPAGSDVTVAWSPDGAEVSIVYPMDEPLKVFNGRAQRPTIATARARLAGDTGSCPDGDGEERAAAEAVISGNLDQAIARARLALQVCPQGSPYAEDVLGSSLLARGVTGMRAGNLGEATADLVEAIGLLRADDARARAHLALGRALRSQGRDRTANAHLRRAAELAPDHPAGRAAKQMLK